MVQMWQRKDKSSLHYRQLKDLPAGSMPLLSEERDASGKLLVKLEVVTIEKKKIVEDELNVPAEYKQFKE